MTAIIPYLSGVDLAITSPRPPHTGGSRATCITQRNLLTLESIYLYNVPVDVISESHQIESNSYPIFIQKSR